MRSAPGERRRYPAADAGIVEDPYDQGLLRFHDRLSTACLVAVAVAAGLTTVGWALDNDFLRQLFAGWPVGLGAALAFVALAISVLMLRAGPQRPMIRTLTFVAGGLVTALGLAALLGQALDPSLHFEELLVPARNADVSSASTSPLLAAGFVFAGGSTCAMARAGARSSPFGDLAAALTAGISELVLLGYGTGIFTLSAEADTTGAPFYAAAFLIAIGAGLLFAFPRTGAAARYSSRGPDGVLVRRLTGIALLVPLGLAIVRWLTADGPAGDTAIAGWLYASTTVAIFLVGAWHGASTLSRGAAGRGARRAQGANRREYQALFDFASEAMFVIGAGGGLRRANTAFAKALGFPSAETLLDEVADLQQLCVGRGRCEELLRTVYEDGQAAGFELSVRRRDGSIARLAVSAWPIQAGDGAVAGVAAIAIDAGDSPTTSGDDGLATAIIASADDAILTVSLAGVIESWNPAAKRLFGYPAAEAIGRESTILIPADRQDEEPDLLNWASAGESVVEFATVRLREDSTPIDVWLTVSPIQAEEGDVTAACMVVRERTRSGMASGPSLSS